MPDFPSTPGSLIRATASDWRNPTVFMLAGDVHDDDYDDRTAWICRHEASRYQQRDLTIVEVIHDEGRKPVTRMRVDLPELPAPVEYPGILRAVIDQIRGGRSLADLHATFTIDVLTRIAAQLPKPRFPVGSTLVATATYTSRSGDQILTGAVYRVRALDHGGWPILDTDQHDDAGGWAPHQFTLLEAAPGAGS